MENRISNIVLESKVHFSSRYRYKSTHDEYSKKDVHNRRFYLCLQRKSVSVHSWKGELKAHSGSESMLTYCVINGELSRAEVLSGWFC